MSDPPRRAAGLQDGISAEDEALQREIERLQRFCSAQGERYPGCPLDIIEFTSAVGVAVTGTFHVGRWLLRQSPGQRDARRAALQRAAARAEERRRQWEQEEAAKQVPRVRVTRVAKTEPHAIALKRSIGRP